MKKPGLLGGMGPESTLLYYREIARRYHAKVPEEAFPSLTIETVNMYEMLRLCRSGDEDALTDYLWGGVQNLQRAGVDFIAITSNTPHVVFDRLAARASVPMLSILQPTCKAIRDAGLQRVAWLGIRFSMEAPYFRDFFVRNGITALVPEASEREQLDCIIAKELEFGVVKPTSKQAVTSIVDRLISLCQAEAVVLGCTELPLMFCPGDFSVPVFDTLQYHIDGIVAAMLEDKPCP